MRGWRTLRGWRINQKPCTAGKNDTVGVEDIETTGTHAVFNGGGGHCGDGRDSEGRTTSCALRRCSALQGWRIKRSRYTAGEDDIVREDSIVEGETHAVHCGDGGHCVGGR